jgi:hypothetical protein
MPRAADEFLAWCAAADVPSIAAVQPVHVATWIEAGTRKLAAPSVKQRLAAIRGHWSEPARRCGRRSSVDPPPCFSFLSSSRFVRGQYGRDKPDYHVEKPAWRHTKN